MYAVQLSGDGRRWRTFVRVADTGERTRDVIDLGAVRARYVRLVLLRGSGVRTVKTSSTPSTPILPMVQELTVGRS
jgi:hypothetical protein